MNRPSGKTTTIQSQLLALPPELLVALLDVLDVRSLLACKLVCRVLRDIIREGSLLQYKIELAIAGMQDVPSNSMTTSKRLAKLRQYSRSWNCLEWKTESTIPRQKGTIWEFCGGVLGQSVQFDSPRSLIFTQLPSDSRDIERRTWMLEDLGFVIRDFSMDPSQDLLVVIEEMEQPPPFGVYLPYRVHLRTLSTGKAHPLGLDGAILSCAVADDWSENGTFSIQMSGDYLGVLCDLRISEAEMTLFIWNWKSGDCVPITYSPGNQPNCIDSFAFVDDEHVLVAQIRRDSWLRIYNFRAKPPTSIILEFPDAAENAQLIHIDILADPAPSALASPGVPFVNARHNQLFVINFLFETDIWGDTSTERQLHMYLPLATLLITIDSGKYSRIPWEQWGPTGTRLWESDSLESIWVCFMHGMKCVLPLGNAGGDSRYLGLQILDFNPSARVNQCHEKRTFYWNERNITLIPPGIFFLDGVETSLPYRITQSQYPFPADRHFVAVMMTEDGLLTVSGDEFADGQVFSLYSV